MDGVFIIDKPEGFTSFDVVAKMRGITGTKKIGHAGTLDPMATGVLPVFLGKATKAIPIMQDHDKEYRAKFQLGVRTDTLDRTGKVLSEVKSHITDAELKEALLQFRGTISQLPPMFSAVKVDGKRLYTLARKGEEVKRKERTVTIYSLELLSFDREKQQGELLISCSQGTYIRTLCSDLGDKLGPGGMLIDLVRTKACGFSLSQASTLSEVQEGKAILHPISSLFKDFQEVKLNEAQGRMFSNGRRLSADRIRADLPEDKLCAVYSQKQFLGIAKKSGNILEIVKNFS